MTDADDVEDWYVPHSPWLHTFHVVVPDLVNVAFAEGDAYRWYMFEPSGDRLDFIEVEVEKDLGVLNPILDEEADYVGWDGMFDMGSIYDPQAVMLVMLEEGLAPNQPFLVRFGPPSYSSYSGYYGEESDVEYDSEIVRVLPWAPEKCAQEWADFLEGRQVYLKYKDECRRRTIEGQRNRVDKMYLTTTTYKTTPYWDYYATGLRYYLKSEYRLERSLFDHLRDLEPVQHMGCGELAYGESPTGDHKEALADLVAKATKEFPHLSEEDIRKLPRKMV